MNNKAFLTTNETGAAANGKLRTGSAALLDQCIVSGTGFITILVISKWAGTVELGLYAIGTSFTLLAQSVQTSLILTPFTIFSPRKDSLERRLFAGSALLHALVLAGIVSLLLFCVGGGLLCLGSVYAPIAFVVAAWIGGILLRDFARRTEFARLAFGEAILIDSLAATLRLSLLVGLAWNGELHATTVIASCGLADLASAVFWVFRNRVAFGVDRNRLRSDLVSNYEFGRWGLASQVVHVVQCDSAKWAIAGFLGPQATGVYSACSSIVQLSSPFIQAAGNFLAPTASNAFVDGGPERLFSVGWSMTKGMAVMLAAYGAMLAVGSEHLLKLFFGESLAPHAAMVSVLGLGLIFSGTGLPAAKVISVLGRPDCNLLVNVLGVLVTATTATVAAYFGSMIGAASGVSLGFFVAFLVRIFIYLVFQRHALMGEVT